MYLMRLRMQAIIIFFFNKFISDTYIKYFGIKLYLPEGFILPVTTTGRSAGQLKPIMHPAAKIESDGRRMILKWEWENLKPKSATSVFVRFEEYRRTCMCDNLNSENGVENQNSTLEEILTNRTRDNEAIVNKTEKVSISKQKSFSFFYILAVSLLFLLIIIKAFLSIKSNKKDILIEAYKISRDAGVIVKIIQDSGRGK